MARTAMRLLLRRGVSPDRIGIWASGICAVHCVLTPIVLSLSAVSVHYLPSEERTHRSMAILIAGLGAIVLVRGFRKHRRASVLTLMAFGLGCIWGTAWYGDRLPSHAVEIGITVVGRCAMIAAHRLNHTFCADCACASERE